MASENVNDLTQGREKLKVSDSYRAVTHDVFHGFADELIAAGLVRLDQLPGSEGMPTTSVTFYDGKIVPRTGARANHDEKFVQIYRAGKRFTVTFGLSKSEREKREDEIKRSNELKKDPGRRVVLDRLHECSAVFQIGDQVFARGVAAEISEGYSLYSVAEKDGEYVCSDNSRCNYEYGYVCRMTTGERLFMKAHQVKKRFDANRVSYLRLVRSR